MGRDKRVAVNQAIEANMSMLAASTVSLVDRINAPEETTFSEWCQTYQSIIEKRNLGISTLRNYQAWLTAAQSDLGHIAINRIQTSDVAKHLRGYTERGVDASAKLARSLLMDVFREAMAEGVSTGNPVAATKPPRFKIGRARLTCADFMAIRDASSCMPPWVQLGMDLALLTAQRMGDVRNIRWANVHDSYAWVEQIKTGAKVCIPLNISLDIIDTDLETVILRCHDFYSNADTTIASSKMLTLSEKMLTKYFAKAREATGLKWDNDPPTFHEIRSLSARLYTEKYGDSFAQKLLGHKSAEMTARYTDPRGSTWSMISV
ncbi:tyrosine-type recombinase/integrase [Pantoea sp. BAV 3049]|uniref:tyrosine-type recombinase/integrase n=1 Tax=Pantoea sp. BAV 3049 TaxID=2654188 RepID=UPI00351AD799